MKKSQKTINYLFLLGLLIALLSFTVKKEVKDNVRYVNTLKNKTFNINGNGFEKKDKDYVISKIETTNSYQHYGNFIQFSDSTFNSYYRAPCGNDCFTDVIGEYKFVSNNVIQIKVLSISKHGDCQMPKNYDKGDFGKYKLIEDKKGVITIKKYKK